MGDVQTKVAIVTGAGTGLGKAAAIALAKEGANVVAIGRRLPKITETVQEIGYFGGSAIAVRADVSVESDVRHAVETALAGYHRVDILVNNAAVLDIANIFDTEPDEWRRQIDVNLTGPFLMTKAALPIMRRQKYGRIVNITSSLAANGAGGYGAYSAAKAGLESLTRTVADEESNYNILANLFDPGMIKSEMHGTGKDPATVAAEIVRLASLPVYGFSGEKIIYS
ncbi:3-oxoacyl-[acyl-carrier-protein] reductase [Paenibacillus sp. CECT 9249]|uniref:SDR family NAD(P)-dependent oxidoreductase n=1 Tax=Paenibacillus sp. CECT 9249 TaxID=2845385 RepID=UPI001E55FDA1|nr:SDR family oxidoreductase [Paenibacillus sp. CECT 9249]CAH0117873.1 3-oxoacyl-[acyl-carrier-protein] reductase [Paenibacillus sp. CECT 9249]